jgi:L-iditol 2-dehydrogenase
LKAALFDEIKHLSFVEKDVPEIEAHEVLIQVVTAGICGSEVHAYIGTHPFRKPPSILGHEIVGKIVRTGEKVGEFQVGDVVTVEPHVGCGNCEQCLDGRYNLCKEKTVLGTQKWDGGFAEYMKAPEQAVYKIPDSIPPHLAVLAEPLAVGVHAVNVADVKEGDKVAILGSGPIGLLTAVAAHYKGAETICLTDAVDSNLEIGKKLCATDGVNVRERSIKDYAETNIGEFDHVFLTFGHPSVIEDAFSVVKRKGKIISIALFEDKAAIDLNQVMISELQIFGSSMYVKEDFNDAIDILTSQKYKLESLVTHRFAFDEISAAMETALTKEGSPIKIVLDLAD